MDGVAESFKLGVDLETERIQFPYDIATREERGLTVYFPSLT
jgi:hypothetical protein